MIVAELVEVLVANRESFLRFALPSGELIPQQFHITEIGRIDKSFIDCGGTHRQYSSCLLQAWVANDIEHRLIAGKLASIFNLAKPVLRSADLPVEVEYGDEVAAQYFISKAEVDSKGILFVLSGKQTDCLAKDQCGVGECKSPDCC